MFGDKRVRGVLIQDGVIQVLAPPGQLYHPIIVIDLSDLGKGKISVRVLLDETPIGPPLDFFYK